MRPSSISKQSATIPTTDREPFDPAEVRLLKQRLNDLERLAYTRDKNVEIIGDPDTAGRKPELYLKSPDGNIWRITIDNTGVISTTAV